MANGPLMGRRAGARPFPAVSCRIAFRPTGVRSVARRQPAVAGGLPEYVCHLLVAGIGRVTIGNTTRTRRAYQSPHADIGELRCGRRGVWIVEDREHVRSPCSRRRGRRSYDGVECAEGGVRDGMLSEERERVV